MREVEPAAVQAFAEAISSLDCLPKSPQLRAIISKLLLIRGITSPEAAAVFLCPSLDQLHPPSLMTGMNMAVERLEAAIERKRAFWFTATMTSMAPQLS